MDAATLKPQQRQVMQARTRRELDALTCAILRAHGQPANADALAQLRKAIGAKRDIGPQQSDVTA